MRNITVCMILVICSPLVAGAQEISDYELFRRAIRRQDIKKITQLIDEGFDVNLRDDHKRILLFEVPYTYRFGREKAAAIAELLINAGADVNARCKNGETPLFDAVRMHDEGIIALLIAGGVDTGIVSDYNESVLNIAVKTVDPKIFNMIWEALPEIDVESPSTLDALGAAIEFGFIEAIEKFMQLDEQVFLLFWDELLIENFKGNTAYFETAVKQGTKITWKDVYNRDLLMWAAMCGHDDLVQLYIQHGLDFRLRDKYGYTPLMWACRQGHSRVAEMLIKAGANIKAADMYRKNAFFLAVEHDRLETVKMLLAYDYNLSVQDWAGYNVLMRAAEAGYTDMVVLLIQSGAPVKAKNCDTETALALAARRGHERVVAELIKAGAPVNITNDYGITPLMWAAFCGSNKVITLLLQAGADIDAQDKYGRTALMHTLFYGFFDTVALLLQAGADSGLKNDDGKTVSELAGERGFDNIVEMISGFLSH
jgi:ankyrin repeat protein